MLVIIGGCGLVDFYNLGKKVFMYRKTFYATHPNSVIGATNAELRELYLVGDLLKHFAPRITTARRNLWRPTHYRHRTSGFLLVNKCEALYFAPPRMSAAFFTISFSVSGSMICFRSAESSLIFSACVILKTAVSFSALLPFDLINSNPLAEIAGKKFARVAFDFVFRYGSPVALESGVRFAERVGDNAA